MKTATTLVGIAAIVLNISSTSACTASDGNKIVEWMKACDSVVGSSQAKCDSKTCHTALHRLIEDETVACYVQLGLGPSGALSTYKPLDNFCHGEGPDPAPPAPGPTPQPTQTPTTVPGPVLLPSTTLPAPAPTSTSASTPSPTSEPKATDKPSGESGESTSEPLPTTATPVDAATTANTTEDATNEEASDAASGNGSSGSEEETVKINPASTPAPVASIPASAASTTAFASVTMVIVGGITATQ